MIVRLSLLWLLAASFIINAHSAPVSPYEQVSLVTNTINWPYNQTTFGNDSFKMGSVKSGNADSLLLALIKKQNGLALPKDFQFGVANSAYQYEGHRVAPNARNPQGIGWSVWDVFSQKGSWLNPQGNNIAEVWPTNEHTTPSGAQAVEGLLPENYQTDITLAKNMGAKYYRLSISWPRLFPHRGMMKPHAKAIAYYQQLLTDLRAQGFTVLITLYHWDLPAWLYNFGDERVAKKDKTYGWLDARPATTNVTLLEFQKYAQASFKYFGAYTPYFSTFNEPLTFTNSALYQGVHAPGKEGFDKLRALNPTVYGKNDKESNEKLIYLQAANVIKAHFLAYKTFANFRQSITQQNDGKPARLGIVLNSDWAEPYRIIKKQDGELNYHPNDIKASKRNMDFMLGWWLNPVMNGAWPQSMQQLVGAQLVNFKEDLSCLSQQGKPTSCQKDKERLSDYIAQGGALDYLMINHYTGYFVSDLDFAKKHFSLTPKEGAVAPSQYGTTPKTLSPGWESQQKTFITQFRYQKYGTSGAFANTEKSRAYVIGRAGAKPWLRHSYFSYTKLLQYINFYYLQSNKTSKQGLPFKNLSIYLTENGTSLAGESQKTAGSQLNDPERIEFIKGNLAAIWVALQQDIKVKLYTYWSITDNFEWSEGYDSRFGLLWIDYDNHLKRRAKDSYYYLQSVIAQRLIFH